MPYESTSTDASTAPHRKNAAQRRPCDSPYQWRTTQRDNPTQIFTKQAVDCVTNARSTRGLNTRERNRLFSSRHSLTAPNPRGIRHSHRRRFSLCGCTDTRASGWRSSTRRPPTTYEGARVAHRSLLGIWFYE
jgi:hypothetical protein